MDNNVTNNLVEYHSNLFRGFVNFILDSPSFYKDIITKLYTHRDYQFTYEEYNRALSYLKHSIRLCDSLFNLLQEQNKFLKKGN